MITLESQNAEETQKLARVLGNVIPLGTTILIEGPLGSGKTTFTQALGLELGVKRAIKSPTYTIVKEYDLEAPFTQLIHIDAYRLEDGGADTIDFDLYFSNENICVIEWPQFIKDYWPVSFIKLTFVLLGDSHRQIQVSTSEELNSQNCLTIKKWVNNL